jgi:2-phospho-L-lactate/phosphoenolpyruvate guanylyltransferase
VSWTVVVPFKGAPQGKSRLVGPGIEAPDRAALALAFLGDALAAVGGVPDVTRVLVVTNEPLFGVRLVADPGTGLNDAIAAGIAAARDADPEGSVAVLLGDLPALRTTDLAAALLEASAHPLAVVADHDGTGTTMTTAGPGVVVTPRFGAGSFARHRAAGHVVVGANPESTLHLDVDTAEDLERARSRGVGPATSALLEPDVRRERS